MVTIQRWINSRNDKVQLGSLGRKFDGFVALTVFIFGTYLGIGRTGAEDLNVIISYYL